MHDDPNPHSGAISVYGPNSAMDDFPVLKAFQQYIDAEQAKARKRLLTLGIFFGILMGAVIAVFVAMLMTVTARNQQLNDRLIEFAMKEREHPHQAAVVVQPPVQQDNSALMAVTSKLEELGKKLTEKEESEKKARMEAEKAKAAAAAEAAKQKGPTPQDLQIAELKAKLAEEKEKLKAMELEAYRRKHYPELYTAPSAPDPKIGVKAPSAPAPGKRRAETAPPAPEEEPADDFNRIMEVLDELDDDAAIDYFSPSRPSRKKKQVKDEDKKPENDYYSIPVDIKGTKSNWVVPED